MPPFSNRDRTSFAECAAPSNLYCAQCGLCVSRGTETIVDDGVVHKSCAEVYAQRQAEHCAYCNMAFDKSTRRGEGITLLNGHRLHAKCVEPFRRGLRVAQPTLSGLAMKYSVGRHRFTLSGWRQRYFVFLPERQELRYYASEYAYVRKPHKSLGHVVIDSQTRLLTRPTRTEHPRAGRSSVVGCEMLIVFSENGWKSELRLLMRFGSSQQQQRWVAALSMLIANVETL